MNPVQLDSTIVFAWLELFLREAGATDPSFLFYVLGTVLGFTGFSYLAGRRALERLLPRLLILTALVLVPLLFYRYNWQSYLPPKMLALHFLTALLLAVFLISGRWRRRVRNPLFLPLALLFLAWVVSSLRATNMAESVALLKNYAVYFTFALLCFHYARSIHFIRLAINLSCITQIAMSIFGMMQISRKIPTQYVFTWDQAVSTIGNVNFCSYYLDVVLPIAAAMLIYNFMRHRYTALYAGIAVVEVVAFNYLFYQMSEFWPFVAAAVLFYALLTAMQWAGMALWEGREPHSLSAFLSTKLYIYSLLFGFLHLFVIDSRGSHVGVLTCMVAMLASWAYFQGAFDLTRLFQRKERFAANPADTSLNRRVNLSLMGIIVGCVLIAGIVIGVASKMDDEWGNRWLSANDAIVGWMPVWFYYFSPHLFNIFAVGLLLAAVLGAWALVTWFYKQPGYALSEPSHAGEGEKGPLQAEQREAADRTLAHAWAAVFALTLLVGVGLIYLTYQGNAWVTELHIEEGYPLGATLESGERVALPAWLDFWSSLQHMKEHGRLAAWTPMPNPGSPLGALLLGLAASVLFLVALWPWAYTPGNLRRTSLLLVCSGALAGATVLLAPLALAYRLAFFVVLGSFYLILFNAVRHVSLRRVDQSSTTHWLGMTALNTLLPMILLAVALSFHHPTILNIWRGKLKEYTSTDLNTILFRFEIWKKSSRMIFDCDAAGVADFANNNFLFGIGAGNFKVVELWFTALPENRVLGKEVLARDPHSYYFLVASEAGLFGVIAMFWLFLVIGWIMVKFLWWSSRQVQRTRLVPEHKRNPRVVHQYSLLFYIMWGFFGGFMATVAHCAFEFNWTQPASATMIYFVAAGGLGLAQAVWRKEREATVFESGRRQVYLRESPYTDAEVAQARDEERADPVEAAQRRFSPQAAAGAFGALLVLVLVFHTGARHFMGENYLKWGMIFQEQDHYDGNSNVQPNLRTVSEMFKAFRRAYSLWPQQMEIFYILGRYHIDLAHDIDYLLNLPDPAQRERLLSVARQLGLHASSQGMKDYLVEGARIHFVDLYMNPNYKWAHNNLGVTMDMLGRSTGNPDALPFEVARQAYQKALVIDTEQIYALFNLGLGYSRRGEYEKAIEMLERASQVDPKKPETFNELARCYANIGQFEKAQETLLRWGDWARGAAQDPVLSAEILVPPNLEIFLKLAQVEMGRRNYREALDYLNLADRLAKDQPEAQKLRAEVLFELGRYGQALEIFKQLIERQPTGDLYYRKGTCEAKLERFFDAQLSLRQAFSMMPVLRQQFQHDRHFESVRERPEFQQLMQ